MTKIFSAWESEAWLPPPQETVDEWAEREVFLPRGVSSIAGRLSLDVTPYLRGPMQAVIDPDVEEIVLCTSSQVGKTTFLVVVLLYFLRNDPWNMFFVMPTEDEALEAKHERLIPIIKESPSLSDLATGDRGEFAGDTIRLNGCTVTFRGANSPSGLASKPVKIACADEIDKWPAWAGKEADPIDLLGERMKTFYDAKFIKCSTPTTSDGRIMKELASSTNERYHVPCPECGEFQALVFGDGAENSAGIKWPEGATADQVQKKALAWYECAVCHGRIEESEKRQMIERGIWAPLGSSVGRSGEIEGGSLSRAKVGYHLWAGYSLWPKASWSRIAAKFLRSKDASASLMNFRNSWLGETWKVTVSELRDQHLRDVQGDYWIREVPEGVDVVTFGVDVQSVGDITYHYYVVRGWSIGGDSYLLDYGRTSGWHQLNSVIFESEFRDSRGQPCTKIRPIVDSGYRAGEVYQWCWENEGIAYKGDARGRRHLTLGEMPRAPESEELIEFVVANPNFYKTELHRLIKSGAWHLPRQVDEEYLAHMTAEQPHRVVEKKTGRHKTEWKVKTDGLANHFFDCEVMALVAADIAELLHRDRPASRDPAEKRDKPQRAKPVPPQGGMVSIFS